MPNGNVCTQKDVTNDCGIGSNKDFALIVDIQVIEIHDVSVPAECFAILSWGFDLLS